eukprot:TRINITY_DN23488_c0_g1_i11.p3 TRINITY_DN23488_c0_g1~~TRINITY_DN23488_c0_g1_i11.p3  ORF type:complete len:248 (-),score=14.61 TRINITY_DN23488_c0_g1_i11:123-866(-)
MRIIRRLMLARGHRRKGGGNKMMEIVQVDLGLLVDREEGWQIEKQVYILALESLKSWCFQIAFFSNSSKISPQLLGFECSCGVCDYICLFSTWVVYSILAMQFKKFYCQTCGMTFNYVHFDDLDVRMVQTILLRNVLNFCSHNFLFGGISFNPPVHFLVRVRFFPDRSYVVNTYKLVLLDFIQNVSLIVAYLVEIAQLGVLNELFVLIEEFFKNSLQYFIIKHLSKIVGFGCVEQVNIVKLACICYK